MKQPAILGRLMVVSLLVSLLLSGTPDPWRVLDRRLCEAIQQRFAPVPSFSSWGSGAACFEQRLPDGRPSPICQESPQTREMSLLVLEVEGLPVQRNSTYWRIQALAGLLQGKATKAVDHFSDALLLDPSADRHNDLAAALLLRSGLTGEVADVARALEHAAMALATEPDHAEASANRDFALRSLGFKKAAGWFLAAYEQAEDGHFDSAPEAPAARSPRARGEVLLGLWAAEEMAGRAQEAAAALSAAKKLAEETHSGGESLLLEAVSRIELAYGDSESWSQLVQGHGSFGELRREGLYSDCDRRDKLAEAELKLKRAGTPFAAWVAIDRAVCDYFDGDLSGADLRIRQALEEWEQEGRPAFGARCRTLLGLIAMLQGRYLAADRALAEASRVYARIGEQGEALYSQALQARNLALGGLSGEAWKARLPALLGLNLFVDRERAATVVQDAVQALRREGQVHAALAAIQEQVAVATEAAKQPGGEEDLLAYARIEKANLFAAIGHPEEARLELDLGYRILSRLPPNQEIRQTIEVELDVARSMLTGEGVLAIDRAIHHYAHRSAGGVGNRIHIMRLLRGRAELMIRQGNLDQAERDLESGLEEVEAQRQGLRNLEQRARFAAQARFLVEELVRLHLDKRNDPRAALAVLDRYEGRLIEGIPGNQPRIFDDLKLVGRWVPPGGLLIRWGQLPDRLLVWTIDSAGELSFESKRVSAERVRELVKSFLQRISEPSPHLDPTLRGKELFELIFPQKVAGLPAGAGLLLIPSPVLQETPFAALPAAADATFLVERHPLVFAPSIGALSSPVGAPTSGKRKGEVLFVADPAFNEELFPFRRLPNAAVEVKAAARAGFAVLAGNQATRQAVLEAMPFYRVLHASAHGITNAALPHEGGLLMAADPAFPEANLLTADDLEGRDLGHLEVVILAACRSALGKVPETAEYAGLASAFLARGVPAVVTAAWDIRDRCGALFFRKVHQRMAAGEDIVAALNAVQVESLRSGNLNLSGSYCWAAFRVDSSGNQLGVGK